MSMIERFTKARNWNDLIIAHVKWLRKELDGQHPNGYFFDELQFAVPNQEGFSDSDRARYVEYLINISILGNMMVFSSQISYCSPLSERRAFLECYIQKDNLKNIIKEYNQNSQSYVNVAIIWFNPSCVLKPGFTRKWKQVGLDSRSLLDDSIILGVTRKDPADDWTVDSYIDLSKNKGPERLDLILEGNEHHDFRHARSVTFVSRKMCEEKDFQKQLTTLILTAVNDTTSTLKEFMTNMNQPLGCTIS